MCCLNIPGLISESKRVSKLSKETLISNFITSFCLPNAYYRSSGFFRTNLEPDGPIHQQTVIISSQFAKQITRSYHKFGSFEGYVQAPEISFVS